ncbi:MAG: PAS domain S-box protein [Bacteroidota bacterium]
MAGETKNIDSKISSNLPSLIIDKSGRVIAVNVELKNLLPALQPNVNFFDIFNEKQLLTIQRIFIDARKYDTAAKDVIELAIDGNNKNFEIIFNPLRSENNVYYLVALSEQQESKSTAVTTKFSISIPELEKITSDKRILSVVNKIKLSYPFTFIEKAKIQKEINELAEFFWLKNIDGKFILINDSYSQTLGFSTAQIENKNEQDFLPKYLINLYKIVEQYIIESTNAVVLEGSAIPALNGANKNAHIVQFPIIDLDNKVVAIIGFSQKTTTKHVSGQSTINHEYFKNLSEAVLLLDAENKIEAYSDEFIKMMLLNDQVDYKKNDLHKIFDKDFVQQIEKYLVDNKNTDVLDTTFTFVEKGNLKTEIKAFKFFDFGGIYNGAQIIFIQKNELQLLTESKAQLYDSIILNSPIAMFIYDLENLKFLEVNDSALKLYGYKRNEFLNMDLTDLYAPEDIQTLIQSGDNKTLNSGSWRHKKSDGTSVLVELNRNSIEYKGKKAHLNLVRNVTDEVSEKKRVQVLQSVFDNTSDLIIQTDKDGFIKEINEHVTKKFGYSKKELESRPFISLVSDDDRAKVNKNIFHSGLLKTSSIEVDIKRPSGNMLKSLVVATPIKDYNGDIEEYNLVIRPNEERSGTKDLKHTQDETLDKIDASFLSNMFHEILTPINVILGFTQELWESLGTPSDEQKEAVDIIKENQKLLMQIMDNAVEYSALQQKVIKFRPEEFRFVEILDELKENTKKFSESKKLEIVYGKISSSLTAETDRQKLVSLISEFLKFAIQITRENTLFLSAKNYDDNNFIVTVKDTRSVITPFLYKGLNDVLSDEETASRKNFGFSRFSMRLVNKLIQLLSVRKETVVKDNDVVEFGLVVPIKFVPVEKISIEVESPKQVKESKALQKPQIKEQPVASFPSQSKELDLSQLSCLYLEDQVDSQILFKNQMRELKSIEFAPSFEVALPLLKTKKFDFIIMDINLQGEYNGLDALRILQKMPGYKDFPIIASTAYMQPGARDNFIAAGFTDFIPKPLLRDKVIETLKRIMK